MTIVIENHDLISPICYKLQSDWHNMSFIFYWRGEMYHDLQIQQPIGEK